MGRGKPAVACVRVCVHTEEKGIKEGGVVALEDSDRLAGAFNCRASMCEDMLGVAADVVQKVESEVSGGCL